MPWEVAACWCSGSQPGSLPLLSSALPPLLSPLGAQAGGAGNH